MKWITKCINNQKWFISERHFLCCAIFIFLIFKEIDTSVTSTSFALEDIIPNPQTQIQLCNRNKSSFICDPDGILNAGEADKLDSFAHEMQEKTRCLCSTCHAKDSGVKMAILIRKTFGINDSSTFESEMKDLASHVRKKWHLGPCSDDIVILLSTINGQSSFALGETVERAITSKFALKIFEDCIGHFANGYYYQGLESMINSFRIALQSVQKIKPIQKKAGSIIGISLGLCILILIVSLATSLRCWQIRKRLRKTNSKYSYSVAESAPDKEDNFKLYKNCMEINGSVTEDLNGDNSSSSDEGIDSDVENEKHENKTAYKLSVPPKFSNNRGRQLSDVAEETQDDDEIEILKYAMINNPRNCNKLTEL